MAEIQEKVIEKDKRDLVSRVLHAKNDKQAIAAWRSDLIRLFSIFNVRSVGSIRQALTVSFPDRAGNQ